MLGDIIDHVLPKRCYEEFTVELKTIVQKVVQNTSDFEALLAMVKSCRATRVHQ